MKKFFISAVLMMTASLAMTQETIAYRPAIAESRSGNIKGSDGGIGLIFGSTYMIGRDFYTGDYRTQVYPTTYEQNFSPTIGLEGWGESHINKFILGGGVKGYYAYMKYTVSFNDYVPYDIHSDLLVLNVNGYWGCQVADPFAITAGLSWDYTWEGTGGGFTSPRENLGCFLGLRLIPVEHFYISLSANYAFLSFFRDNYLYYYVGEGRYSCYEGKEHPFSAQIGIGFCF